METLEQSESVAIQLAGAPFRVGRDTVEGSFHPIPLSLWAAIIGFHRAVSLASQAESVSLHRWHAGSSSYHSLIPYQNTAGGGLSVSYNPSDANNQALLDRYGALHREDFCQGMLTIHTHVDVSAFESGTDAADEKGLAGWHITLGKLISAPQYHLDCRIRLPNIPKVRALIETGNAYKIDWSHLFPLGTEKAMVDKIPGSTAWHHLLHRVNVR